MSGGIHSITIENDTTNIRFTLHNATDPTAQKIVAILNTYIPDAEQKRWLFDITPAED